MSDIRIRDQTTMVNQDHPKRQDEEIYHAGFAIVAVPAVQFG